MLLTFVILYLVLSIAIGLAASTRVHNTRDYVVAGRTLPLYIVTTMVFATWFGSETVLGISSTFIKEGLRGIVADPFGSSLCLVLVGLFFAAKLYRMDLLTIGDYYRVRYDATAELLTSVCIAVSYLGWLSAQIVVIGLVFNAVTGGAMYIVITVSSVFFGRSVGDVAAMAADPTGIPQGVLKLPPQAHTVPVQENVTADRGPAHHAPGTLVLVGVFLVAFIVYYFLNWKLLAGAWKIG